MSKEKRNVFWLGFVALLIALVLVSVFVLRQRQEAKEQKQIALKKSNEAEANRLALHAVETLSEDPTAALSIAEKAWNLSKNKTVTRIIYKIYRENLFYKIILKDISNNSCMVVSPDGRTLVTTSGKENTKEGAKEYTVRLWDLTGLRRNQSPKNSFMEFKGHGDVIRSLALSPDGKYLLTGSDDKTIRLWNMQGHLLREFKGHKEAVYSLAFSPDGKCFVAVSIEKVARLWSINGNLLQGFRGHNNPIMCVVFSPDGRYILTGSTDNTARLWSRQGKPLLVLKGHRGFIGSLAFSPDGKYLLTGSADDTARLWDINGELLHVLKGHSSYVRYVAFSPDGRICLTGSGDHTVRLWDTTGKQLYVCKGHKDSIRFASFLPDGTAVITGSLDNTIRLWDMRTHLLTKFRRSHGEVKSATFSPDGNSVLIGSTDMTARLWRRDGKQGKLVQEFKPKNTTSNDAKEDHKRFCSDTHFRGVFCAALSPDGKTVLTGSDDSTARLWNINGTPIQTFSGHLSRIFSVAFSPDAKTILTGSADQTARLWDLHGNQLQIFSGHSETVNCVAFSPNGKNILTGSDDRTARLWNLHGKLLHQFNMDTGQNGNNANNPYRGKVLCAIFSPDGNRILVGAKDGFAWLWNRNGKLLFVLDCAESVRSVDFSPDNKIILTAGSKNVCLWSLKGNLFYRFYPPNSLSIGRAVFSPSGKEMLICYNYGDACMRTRPMSLVEFLME